jgi:Holliday junction DNA helicase RuvA
MIGWLQGQVAGAWQQANRFGLLLICQGVGYEVQVSQRHWPQLPAEGGVLALHVHQSIREDGWTLYGFPLRQERDLFRELVAVSGVGPQMALGLLGQMEAAELIRAIVQADLRRLSQAPGVGKRTAERLAVELRQRLQERFGAELDAGAPIADDLADATLPEAGQREEVQITLEALGYEALEIHRALRGVAAAGLALEASSDTWIRECLRWLSRSAA